MKTMSINKTRLWYANLAQEQTIPVYDSDGLMTGEYKLNFETPQPYDISISESIGLNNLTAQGVAELKAYGITTNYTHRMITEDMDCPIKEDSAIWYDREPGPTADDVPFNFRVVRVSRSLNHKMYYLRQVDHD